MQHFLDCARRRLEHRQSDHLLKFDVILVLALLQGVGVKGGES